jgi:hypothetical protein
MQQKRNSHTIKRKEERKKEKAEQARESKPVNNIPPWPLHQLLLRDLLDFQY